MSELKVTLGLTSGCHIPAFALLTRLGQHCTILSFSVCLIIVPLTSVQHIPTFAPPSKGDI